MLEVSPTSDQKQYNDFMKLCELMDTTNFMASPYKGVLKTVARELKLNQGSMTNLIKRYRNVRAMTAVAREMARINKEIREATKEATK